MYYGDPSKPIEYWILTFLGEYRKRFGMDADTVFIHPETLGKLNLDIPEVNIVSSIIILKNNYWIGISEEEDA